MNSRAFNPKLNCPGKAAIENRVINIIKRIREEEKSFQEQKKKYYEEIHNYHQSEQGLLRLKRQLFHVLQENDLGQFQQEVYVTGQLHKEQYKVVIYDEQSIPSKFATTQRIINIVKVKSALIKGEEVPGAYLEDGPFGTILKKP